MYRVLGGVSDVVSGYSGGQTVDPSYQQVCTGRTGHAAVVAVHFDPAEDYHQDFFAKNPGQGYCMAVALPKVNKIRKAYSQYLIPA